MNHITSGMQEANLLAHRHHQRIVDFTKINILVAVEVATREGRCKVHIATHLASLVVLGSQLAVEGQSLFVHVVVMPAPLITRDLDGHFRVAEVFHLDKYLCRRYGHDNKDDQRGDRPYDFNRRALVKSRRFYAFGFAMRKHRIDHHGKYQRPDHTADIKDAHVQVIDLLAHLGNPAGHVQRPPIGQCTTR